MLKNALTAAAPTPYFAEPLHVGRPNTGNRDAFLARVNDIFDRRWFTNNGHYVQELESILKQYLGVRHCIPVCNATVGLAIVACALGLDGEVIVPSFTFVATPHALAWQGIQPVFCDIDPKTHNLDPEKVERLVTRRTTGILATHVWGRSVPTQALEDIARRNGLKVYYDAAHAFGCSSGGTMIGNFGDAEVFSFHATKFFNTFEGGAIATNDDELAKKIRLAKNFGFTGPDAVAALGINGKMPEICAAMGVTCFESLDEIIARNLENYRLYSELLGQIPGISLVQYDESERNNFQYVIAEIDADTAGFNRDELVTFLHSHNVLARRYFYPGCHRMRPYSLTTYTPDQLEQTERLSARVVSLPSGTAVGSPEIRGIAALVQEFQAGARP